MNNADLLSQGITLMFLGMGMVFFILGLLIVIIKLSSILITRYEPVYEDQNTQGKFPSNIDDDVVSAIAIAVERFRNK